MLQVAGRPRRACLGQPVAGDGGFVGGCLWRFGVAVMGWNGFLVVRRSSRGDWRAVWSGGVVWAARRSSVGDVEDEGGQRRSRGNQMR